MTASALYEGTIRHRRFAERPTEFRHGLALAYVDLDELPRLLGGRFVRRRPGLVRFRRADYLGDRGAARRRGARRSSPSAPAGAPTGRSGCSRSCARSVTASTRSPSTTASTPAASCEALVAEVTNTPWGERHAYVLPAGARAGVQRAMDKALHVSPFMEMDQRLRGPGDSRPPRRCPSTSSAASEGERAFDATLALQRRALTTRTLAEVTVRYPAARCATLVLIYGHAVGLLAARGRRSLAHPGRG